jgi:hypothetical protein
MTPLSALQTPRIDFGFQNTHAADLSEQLSTLPKGEITIYTSELGISKHGSIHACAGEPLFENSVCHFVFLASEDISSLIHCCFDKTPSARESLKEKIVWI